MKRNSRDFRVCVFVASGRLWTDSSRHAEWQVPRVFGRGSGGRLPGRFLGEPALAGDAPSGPGMYCHCCVLHPPVVPALSHNRALLALCVGEYQDLGAGEGGSGRGHSYH